MSLGPPPTPTPPDPGPKKPLTNHPIRTTVPLRSAPSGPRGAGSGPNCSQLEDFFRGLYEVHSYPAEEEIAAWR